MIRLTVALVLIVILAACGGGGDSDNGAGDAAVNQYEMAIRDQWGRVWDELHPAQQAVVPRDLYDECQSQTRMQDFDISVDETFEETIDVAELGEVETTAVTLEFDNGETSQFVTSHLIEVDGEWKWILPSEAVASFASGECP